MKNTDRGAIPFAEVTVKRMAGAGGAEIGGVDLSRPINNDVWAIIKKAFLDHHVLVFRDQELTPAQQVAVAQHFGTITETPLIKSNGDGTSSFVREADASRELWTYGNYWHFDGPFSERPPLAVMLYAVESPPYGGDTLFANGAIAYETLSPLMKAIADRMTVIYRPDDLIAKLTATRSRDNVEKTVQSSMEHPLVCFHPQTGRKSLVISGDIAAGIRGLRKEESRPLLDFFHQHAHREEFTIRVRWNHHTVTLWDNRALQHYAVDDYSGFRREMRRVEIGGGDQPSGPAAIRAGSQTAPESLPLEIQ